MLLYFWKQWFSANNIEDDKFVQYSNADNEKNISIFLSSFKKEFEINS